MTEIEKYLESQRALDENGKPDDKLVWCQNVQELESCQNLSET